MTSVTSVTDLPAPRVGETLHAIASELGRDPRLTSANTRRGYLADLSAFEQWRGERPLTRLLVEEYAAQMRHDGRAAQTVNRVLAAIRWWARRRLGDLALADASLPVEVRQELTLEAARITDVADLRGDSIPKGRRLSMAELTGLLQVCVGDLSPAGTRDAAIIALAWATGARRSELAGLTLASYASTGQGEGELVIHGERGRARSVALYGGSVAYLADWLAVRGRADGPLFYAINKGGVVQVGHGISDEALAQVLEKRCRQAGTQMLTWHDFRRTFAGNLLDEGYDLVVVQRLMGHASPATTVRYDRRSVEPKRGPVQGLQVPYGV